MSNKYYQGSSPDNVHFSKAFFGDVEHSRVSARPTHLTTFNGGELIPIYCREILPDESVKMSLDFVIRQTTLLTPTMGECDVTFTAFFVPNRVVNKSWKEVEGENASGSWVSNPVSLAPLAGESTPSTVNVPVNSVADYYGFPTQAPLRRELLAQCHDLKFRGYVAIWNEFFRDQNYQPPIPISYLNVYQGFFDLPGTNVSFDGSRSDSITLDKKSPADGSYGKGAILKSIVGGSGKLSGPSNSSVLFAANNLGRFRATSSPLKVNKLHDYYTTVLPSPQKSLGSVFAPVTGQISSPVPVIPGNIVFAGAPFKPLIMVDRATGSILSTDDPQGGFNLFVAGGEPTRGSMVYSETSNVGTSPDVVPGNLQLEPGATVDGLALSVDDIRMASAIQQCYEIFARGGTRYRELVQSMFGIYADDPFSDIPQCLCRVHRSLDLFQTAQTSSSQENGTPQGNLAAFGYTNSHVDLFEKTFVEHGYLHIFACVRHRNIYSTELSRDNFRLNAFDFYMPPLANISEQPVYTKQINPFVSDLTDIFGYQEAFAEYRYEQDTVTGLMRPGVDGSLSVWNYADPVDSTLRIADGEWLRSNTREVIDRTVATTSSIAPQFKGQFVFDVSKDLPMPTYSVPAMDII